MKTALLMIAALLAVHLHAEPPSAAEASIVTTNRTLEPAQIPPDKRILVRAQFGGVALKDIKSSTSFIEAELIQKVFEDGKSQTIEVIRELRYPTELEVTPMNGTAKLEVTPSNFATKNLGLTLTLTATRKDQSIMFHGSCVIRRHVNYAMAKSPIEPETPTASAHTVVARECDFAGMAPMGQAVIIDVGEKGVDSGNLMLSFLEDKTPPTNGPSAEELARFFSIHSWQTRVPISPTALSVELLEIADGKVGASLLEGHWGTSKEMSETAISIIGSFTETGLKASLEMNGSTVFLHPPNNMKLPGTSQVIRPLPKILEPGQYILGGHIPPKGNVHSVSDDIKDYKAGVVLRIKRKP